MRMFCCGILIKEVNTHWKVAIRWRLKSNSQMSPAAQSAVLIDGMLFGLLIYLKKIKIFLWRATKNLLPTGENLWKRKCLQDPICQRCCRTVETINHALLECKATKKIWMHAPFPFNHQNASSQDILSSQHHSRLVFQSEKVWY